MPRHIKAVEITRTSLQSLVIDLFRAFCFVSFVVPDYALRTQDDPPGIAADTRVLDKHLAISYYAPDATSESLYFSWTLLCW